MVAVTRRGATWKVTEPVCVPGWRFWNGKSTPDAHSWIEGWEDSTLDVIERIVRPGSTYVDIGAWIGPTSLWAAHCGAHVIAVEPDPVALEYLRSNVTVNDADVTVVAGALSDHTGTCLIAAHPDGWGSSMTRLTSSGMLVDCWTLPDLFSAHHITDCSMVKMDIEGGEAIVLEHVAPFLAGLGVPLLVSMHEPWWTRSIDPSWFAGFSTVEGELARWEQVLCLP